MADLLTIADPAAVAAVCRQRAATYGLLSRMYRVEVDQALYDELKAASYPTGTGNDDVDLGYRKIATYLSGASHGVLLELAVDYVRTFIGHRNDTFGAAYPFESVYTSEKRLLMQEARTEVVAIYRAAGMTVDKDWQDPEDHIALELEYMQVRALETAEALERCADAPDAEADMRRACAGIDQQRAFLENHLMNWVPLLTQDMRHFAQTDFYQGLACLTDGVLQLDAEFFAELAG